MILCKKVFELFQTLYSRTYASQFYANLHNVIIIPVSSDFEYEICGKEGSHITENCKP